MPDNLPDRKHPAHPSPVERHNEPVIVLVTACTKRRQKLLNNQLVRDALVSAWIVSGNWRVGLYTIMPDHVHLFCRPSVPEPVGIKKWVKYWKSLVSKEMKWGTDVWQLDCWDVQMRSQSQYVEKRNYVRENPVRGGLTDAWENWLYTGELNPIEW